MRLDARPGTVYGYPLRDPQTGQVRIDYVGRARDLARRDGQHRGLVRQRTGEFKEQPWSDLIEGGPVVLASGIWTDDELDAEELWHIRTPTVRPRPRYNRKGNEDNPEAIPIPVAQRQRDARDVARGLQPRDWNAEHGPGLHRPAVSRPVPGRPQDGLWTRAWATPQGRRISGWLRAAAKVAGAWLALTVALTVGLAVWGGAPFKDAANVAAVLVAVVLGGALYLFRPRRGGRTKNRTNRRRRTR